MSMVSEEESINKKYIYGFQQTSCNISGSTPWPIPGVGETFDQGNEIKIVLCYIIYWTLWVCQIYISKSLCTNLEVIEDASEISAFLPISGPQKKIKP